MELTELTQLVGIMVAGAASMRAAISVASFAGRKYQFARQEKQYIAQFRHVTAGVFEDRQLQPQKTELLWQGKRKFRVVNRVYENLNQDICSFYLEPYDGRSIPSFRPGQFLTFSVPVPGEAEPVTRCYSLSDSPAARNCYRITVKRIAPPANAPEGTPPGKSSNYFHDHVQIGSVIDVYAPSGSFCLEENSDRPVVLIAGGVGITPIISMLNWLIATRSNREIWLFYGVRNRGEHAMYDYLQQVAAQVRNVRIIVAYNQPTNSCLHNVDYHLRGNLTEEHMRPILEGRDCEIYLCGPTPMMNALTRGFESIGVPADNVRFETFGPASPTTRGTSEKPREPKAEQAFQIEFARSGKKVEWLPGGGSLLDLALENGIKARCACRQGMCGTCSVALTHGSVEYERTPEKTPAAGKCLPCVARPQSDLVLDM
ncbi:MAG: 2Fe-2S iron-sulfur cluster-binding protein [Pseudomonadota bacterium]